MNSFEIFKRNCYDCVLVEDRIVILNRGHSFLTKNDRYECKGPIVIPMDDKDVRAFYEMVLANIPEV